MRRDRDLTGFFKIALVVAIVVAMTMALLPKPPHLPIDRFGDKFQHMLAFATLAALASFAYPAARGWKVLERLSFLGAMVEVLQSIPSLHRDCDIGDWIADTIAIALVVAIIALVRQSRPPRIRTLH
ncbi:hypothetical protein [Sphingomonas sp. Leaf20]|uniref:hypothetical protein n=1 Tax=Sphingomonas sp. Leaf20 TaxID=1735685 RepID=UPI0006FF7807|nr:hypothetical protein [Sphingomonas sp. Leaf20]KQM71872.1 hypothetical protein ASE72_10285 [Sphingomonas sp. Leaf20]